MMTEPAPKQNKPSVKTDTVSVDDHTTDIDSVPQSTITRDILKLQATLGNQAVQRLLAQNALPGIRSQSGKIQRLPKTKAAAGNMTKWLPLDFMKHLFAFLQKSAFYEKLRTMNRSKFKDKDMRKQFKLFMEREKKGEFSTNERWLADVLLVYGPEKDWPFYIAKDAFAKKDIHSFLKMDDLKQHKKQLNDFIVEDTLGFSDPVSQHKDYKAQLPKGQTKFPIKSYYIEGTSNERALIIGGMHGSELSGVEAVENLVAMFKKSKKKPYYTVIIIPQLFPANVALAKTASEHKTNWGRFTPKKGYDPLPKGDLKNTDLDKKSAAYKKYLKNVKKDPNRQYPKGGKAPDLSPNPVDAKGKAIEHETAILTKLIAFYKPSRVANVHSIHSSANAGIYVDPPTDAEQYPITDKAKGPTLKQARALDKRMWKHAKSKGAVVKGNVRKRPGEEAEQYPKDKPFEKPSSGKKQERVTDKGWSTGGYYSSGVEDKEASQFNRAPMIWITVEIAGGEPGGSDASRKKELEAHTLTLHDIFLGPDKTAGTKSTTTTKSKDDKAE